MRKPVCRARLIFFQRHFWIAFALRASLSLKKVLAPKNRQVLLRSSNPLSKHVREQALSLKKQAFATLRTERWRENIARLTDAQKRE